jgi:hypothetical protein
VHKMQEKEIGLGIKPKPNASVVDGPESFSLALCVTYSVKVEDRVLSNLIHPLSLVLLGLELLLLLVAHCLYLIPLLVFKAYK